MRLTDTNHATKFLPRFRAALFAVLSAALLGRLLATTATRLLEVTFFATTISLALGVALLVTTLARRFEGALLATQLGALVPLLATPLAPGLIAWRVALFAA